MVILSLPNSIETVTPRARRRGLGKMRLRHRNLRFRLDVEVAKDEGFEEARRTYGLRRADRSRFPYEPRVVGGKLMSPVELQRLRRFILDTAVIEAISD